MNMGNGKCLGLVMAASHSARMPRKNTLPIAGKPAMGWAIQTLKASEACEVVAVSTDTTKDAKLATMCGADEIVLSDPSWKGKHMGYSMARSLEMHDMVWTERYEHVCYIGGNAVSVRPSWFRVARHLLANYYFHDKPITHVTNDLSHDCFGVIQTHNLCRFLNNTFELRHRGFYYDFDYDEDYKIVCQLMECIESGAIDYSLDETIHEVIFQREQHQFLTLIPGECL